MYRRHSSVLAFRKTRQIRPSTRVLRLALRAWSCGMVYTRRGHAVRAKEVCAGRVTRLVWVVAPAVARDCTFARQRHARQDRANANGWSIGGSEDEAAQKALEQVRDGSPRNQGHPGRVPAGEVRYARHHPGTYQAAQAERGLFLYSFNIGGISEGLDAQKTETKCARRTPSLRVRRRYYDIYDVFTAVLINNRQNPVRLCGFSDTARSVFYGSKSETRMIANAISARLTTWMEIMREMS